MAAHRPAGAEPTHRAPEDGHRRHSSNGRTPLPALLALQKTAGNRAVKQLVAGSGPVVQRSGEDMAAALNNRAQEQIAAAAQSRGNGSDSTEPPEPPSAEAVAAEKAKQRRAVTGTVTPTDTSGARSEAAGAAQAVATESSKPAEPVTAAGPAAAPAASAAGSGGGGAESGTGEAQEAAGRAAAAAAEADAVAVPEAPAPVELAVLPDVVDGGGRQVPLDPALQGAVSGVAARIHLLRAGAHEVRTAAAAERAQGHRLDGMLHAGMSAVADAADGITALNGHTAHRRGVVTQARSALGVSQQKAEVVATGAPTVKAKGEEGSEKSTPMATESAGLAGENASHAPEDSEAAGKSGEQGAKLTQTSSQLATIDSTITQTKARADSLAAEAAEAKQSNAATEGQLGETEQAIAQVEAKSQQLAAQNAAARSRLAGMAAQPAAHRAEADQLEAQGQATHDASVQLETRLQASEEGYLSTMAGMPPPVPARGGPGVQRDGYEGRTTYDPAGAVSSAVPSWLTGEDPPNAAVAAQHKVEADARRAAETAEIEREAGGHFDQLSSSQKMGIALRLTGRNVLHELGETNLPKFGLTLLRGFIDPRVSLMGVVHGVGQIVSGVANLLSAEQWRQDPLGNALKSSADIATGVTIVLGSIAGLAVAIGIILTAVAIVGSIFSFGAVGLALAPIIAFCGTVAATVGPWALWAAGIALALHALVFIKNLVDAASAKTAASLQTSSERMTEDAKNAGAMALQIGMAKAMEAIGARLKGSGGEPPGGGAGAGEGAAPASEVPAAAGDGAPTPVEAPAPAPAEAPAPAQGEAPVAAPGEVPARAGGAANDNAVPLGESPADLPSGPAANDNVPRGESPPDLPSGPAANDNVPRGETPPDLPSGPAANDNAVPSSEPVSMPEPVKMAADGTLPSASGPDLRVLPGGAGEGPVGVGPEGPVAAGGGQSGGPGSVPEPGRVATTEGPGPSGGSSEVGGRGSTPEVGGPEGVPETAPESVPERAPETAEGPAAEEPAARPAASGELTVEGLKQRAFRALARAREIGRGDLGARANELRAKFGELERAGALSPEEVAAFGEEDIAALEQLESELPPEQPEFPEGSHTRLSQEGGLKATEGDRVTGPDGQEGDPAHPLKEHGPGTDDNWLRHMAEESRNGMAAKFTDRATMESTVGGAIDANQAAIDAWLAGNPPAGTNLPLPRFNPGTGNLGEGFMVNPATGVVEPIPASMPLTEAQVVLKATGQTGPGTRPYVIQTAYPVAPGR